MKTTIVQRFFLQNPRLAVRRRHAQGWQTRLRLELLENRALLAASGFVETSLASDIQGAAAHTDPDLINPWALSESANGGFWIAANGAGNSPLLTPGGTEVLKGIVIPPPASAAGTTAAPRRPGQCDLRLRNQPGPQKGAPAALIYSTEDGTISGWNPAVSIRNAVLASDQSATGAVYKGLAAGTSLGKNYLYATDFHNGQITVFDQNFKVVNLSGSFTDPSAPPPPIGAPGFAPFGIANIGGKLYVSYALQDSAQHDDVAGTGNGFIDVFDTSGHFLERFASGTSVGGRVSQLNSPWGMTVAPASYGGNGVFSNALLVGNFGDSHVSAFNIQNGAFIGQLTDSQGSPLTLNGGIGGSNTKGLWGIEFGNGAAASINTLFFAAGVNDEGDGLFGEVTFSAPYSRPASGSSTTPLFAMPNSTASGAQSSATANVSLVQAPTASHTTPAPVAVHPTLLSIAATTTATAKAKAVDTAMGAHATNSIL